MTASSKKTAQVKPKDQLLELVDTLIEKLPKESHGVYSVLLTEDQNHDTVCSADDGTPLKQYGTYLSTAFLQACICRLPRTEQDPDGIQRALITQKVTKIKEAFSEGKIHHPDGSVTITFRTRENKIAPVPYVSLTPIPLDVPGVQSSCMLLSIDLRQYRQALASAKVDRAGFLADPEQVMPGIMIDGHHRTEGAALSGCLEFNHHVSIYLNIHKRDTYAIFYRINNNQDHPSSLHSAAMKRAAGLLSDDELSASEMVSIMAEQGLFRQHIRMFDGPRDKSLPRVYINSNVMERLLLTWLENNRSCYYKCADRQDMLEQLEAYFRAWKEVYPAAWDDKDHVLTKSMGITLMFRLYGPLCNYINIDAGGSGRRLRQDMVVKALRDCFLPDGEPIEISIGDSLLPLDWSSGNFGSLSSGKGINQLGSILSKRVADQTPAAV